MNAEVVTKTTYAQGIRIITSMKHTYCWHCKQIVPMLEESEWDEVGPLFDLDVQDTKQMRGEGLPDEEIKATLKSRACERYEAITGMREQNVFTLWHHRRSLYGPDCPSCGRPFRTPDARFCAECGYGQKTKTT